MTITIYTICTEDHYRLGAPAMHTLTEPAGISRARIERNKELRETAQGNHERL